MAVYSISSDTLIAIADAIRLKTGSSEQLTTEQMVSEIQNLIVDTQDLDDFLSRSSTSIESSTAVTIAAYAMFTNQKIETVNLPSVTNIGNYAFCSCGNLKYVNTNAVSIGSYAFYGCDQLETFVWHDTIEQINVGAFDGCSALLVVDLSNTNLNSISASAFANSGVSELRLPKTQFCALSNSNVFDGSPLGAGGDGGKIYVPRILRVQYESNGRWSSIFLNDKNTVISY